MMNYEMFKGVVKEGLMDYLSGDYKDMHVEITEVPKINKVREAITLRGAEEGRTISPTIYLDTLYQRYQETDNFKEIMTDIANAVMEAESKGSELRDKMDFDNAKENIIFQLINSEQNKEMLKDIPHRDFEDLSVIYRWVIDTSKDGMASTVITDSLAKNLGLDEGKLFKLAAENTKRILPPVVRSMNDVIKNIFLNDGMPEEMLTVMLQDVPADQQMYVISNDRGLNGAISMMYEDKLFDLAETLGSDLIILPSSVHEVIAVSANMGDPEELAEMVASINQSQVSLEDRLSNQVYKYDRNERKLSLATDTPNKRLDGTVAEQTLIYETKSKSI